MLYHKLWHKSHTHSIKMARSIASACILSQSVKQTCSKTVIAVYIPAGFVLMGEYSSLSLHPTMLQASTANSYLVYGLILVVILIIVEVVEYCPDSLDICTNFESKPSSAR